MTSVPRICILGGGFGGLYTALRLNQLAWEPGQKPEITLIDRHSNFVFTPLLYELITGEMQGWEIAPPFAELLKGTDIRFVQGAVKQIDKQQKTVKLEDDAEIAYDRLVLSLGCETPADSVPGVAEHAIAFRSLEDAYKLDTKLRLLEASSAERIRVAIVGAGYTGVEVACKLADRLKERGRIRLIQSRDTILPNALEFNRNAALKALEQRGIWVDLETNVSEITADTIGLIYKGVTDTIPVEVVMWTVGNQVSPAIDRFGLPSNAVGKITVTETLQVTEHPEIFALGDAAAVLAPHGESMPPNAQVAFQQSDFVAWNVWSSLTNRPLLPFQYTNLGEMLTLGDDNAVLSGMGIQIDGPLAYLARRLVYLYRLPTLEHQLKVGFNWLTQPLVKMLS
ncbi:NAD(P)/FAD-dependent oxidoreductase [Chamaesiphon polymorphus]|uniref:demethylphylloquinone reductase n=1 Tax=Chamaesiphon polymorphus CCALA 037 TaxID=2107692 RepID=A0A2T1GLX8_9CYAN|nr:NAD(P)/FAD-dependent oxidoreductase [Chamaesiphon polymorphus]PSB58890.1 FAD-dependent oxidoreductase [Chamaesiphon polymorphus CCALA 037]